jgi:hypothetical protein
MPHDSVPSAATNSTTLNKVLALEFRPDTVAVCASIPKFSLGLKDGVYQERETYFTSCSICLKVLRWYIEQSSDDKTAVEQDRQVVLHGVKSGNGQSCGNLEDPVHRGPCCKKLKNEESNVYRESASTLIACRPLTL